MTVLHQKSYFKSICMRALQSLKAANTLNFGILIFFFSGPLLIHYQFMGASSSSKKTMYQPPVVIQPKENVTASLIFLHGLGDQGFGWGEQFKELSFKNLRCICPHAPLNPVTLNGGMMMPSWFDIKGLSPNSEEDESGIKESSKTLQNLIAEEIKKGIPANRIYIGGFSQGGAVAMYSAYRTDIKIGGVVALSSWMPLHKQFIDESKPKYNMDVPIIQCHGNSDPLVSPVWGRDSHNLIKKYNPDALFKNYPGLGHSSSPQEMKDVKEFLEDTLKKS